MPKVVDHDERRAAVIEATCQVIARSGIEAATIRGIATAAGCSTGLVTHYFRNKDDIILAAVKHVFGRSRQRAMAELHGPPMEALERILLDSLPLNETSLLEWRVWLVFWGRAYTNEDLVLEQSRSYNERIATIQELLASAQALEMIDAAIDVGMATTQTLAIIDGLGIQGVFSPSPAVRKRLRLAVKDYIESFAPGGQLARRADESHEVAT